MKASLIFMYQLLARFAQQYGQLADSFEIKLKFQG